MACKELHYRTFTLVVAEKLLYLLDRLLATTVGISHMLMAFGELASWPRRRGGTPVGTNWTRVSSTPAATCWSARPHAGRVHRPSLDDGALVSIAWSS